MIERGDSFTWIEFVITEGRNRQVRRLCGRSRLEVSVLRRVRFGPLELGELEEGQARALTQEEVNASYEVALPGVKVPKVLGF